MVPVVLFVGNSNSGKTYCIERIIPELKKKGYKVGAIKHAPDGFKLDYERRDSYRMTRAGADTVVISSPNKVGMIKSIDNEIDIETLRKQLFKDVNILIVEGYKLDDFPKIAIFRNEIDYRELKKYREKLMAVLCDMELDDVEKHIVDVPCFKKEDIEEITSFIIKKLIKSPLLGLERRKKVKNGTR
jgi:molybdopterin-guanine dinucleotide biosynthesis protein B